MVIRKKKNINFKKNFYIPVWFILAVVAAIGLLPFFQKEYDDSFIGLMALVATFPVYFIQRRKHLYSEESSKIQPRWRVLSDLLWLGVTWISAEFLIARVIEVWAKGHSSVSEFDELVISAALSFVVLYGLIRTAAQAIAGEDFLTAIRFRKENQKWAHIFLFPFLAGLIFAAVSSHVITEREVQPSTPLSEVMQTVDSSGSVLFFMMLALCIAPLLEEMIFRGYLYRVLSYVKSPRVAFYCVAVTFGLMHVGQYYGDWAAITMVTLVGFALTMTRVWTGTVLASAVMHYTYNIGVIIIPIVLMATSNPAYIKYQMTHPNSDFQTKEKLLKESIKAKPEFAEAYNDLAWLYAEENINLPQALEYVETALHYHPDSTAMMDTKAEVLTRLGLLEEARNLRSAILELNPPQSVVDYQYEKLKALESENGSL